MSLEMALRLPSQPPTKSTWDTVSPSSSTWMAREQTPCGV